MSGRNILRPIIRAWVTMDGRVAPIPFVLDSGADHSLVSYHHATELLGVDPGSLEVLPSMETEGVGDRFRVVTKEIILEIRRDGTRWHGHIPVRIPVVPTRGMDASLLGREPFFRIFDVLFQLGRTATDPVPTFSLIWNEGLEGCEA